MAFFLIGSFVLGLAWILIFFVASLVIYLIAFLLSLFGVFMDISGDNNIWLLFLVVIGISSWVFNLDGSNFGYSVFVFMSGSFLLFKTADNWKIASC